MQSGTSSRFVETAGLPGRVKWLLPDMEFAHEDEVEEHGHCHDNPHYQENCEADVVFAHREVSFVRHAGTKTHRSLGACDLDAESRSPGRGLEWDRRYRRALRRCAASNQAVRPCTVDPGRVGPCATNDTRHIQMGYVTKSPGIARWPMR